MALNEITKGMSNAAEQIGGNFKTIEKYVEDTGWIALNLEKDFSESTTSPPAYRKVGDVVYFRGAVTNDKLILSSSDVVKIATLPTTITPSVSHVLRQQGSSINSFLLTFEIDGRIGISRYGKEDYVNISPNSWLNISATYML